MNHKDRFTASIEHRTGDRMAIDCGATPVSGMHVSCVAALRAHYGLTAKPVKVTEPYQMLGEVDEELLDILDIDVVGIAPRKTIFGFANEGWKPWRTPWRQEVLVSEHFVTKSDASGNVYIHPEGDPSAPASGHMPASGYFFDTIIRQPQRDLDLDTCDVADNLEEFDHYTEADLDHYASEVARCEATERAIIANIGGTALGDIALVPAPFLKQPKGLRDIAEWYMGLVSHPHYAGAIFDRQVELALSNLQRLHARVGNRLDAVMLCGTDFGTQSGTFCSPTTFQDMWLPRYRQITDWIHQHTSWKCFKHSCGAVAKFVPLFIEAGFDILNPVQCSATGMDPATLKSANGADIVFWGGGIDTQQVLPFGSPDEVAAQVQERCRIFAPGGGFVFNSIHNVQALTPIDNLVACLETARDWRNA
ncbi:MAG: methyltransferase [Planctomycetota bacterium]|jgi:hypothetical protein|nr:methyltransferase [Planctomycetota bacterium]